MYYSSSLVASICSSPCKGRCALCPEIVPMPLNSPKLSGPDWSLEPENITSPYRDVIRAKIILLAAEGLSHDIIASRLDTPRQIVSKWRKRFALARLPGLESQPRGGRPALFSPQRRRPS